MAIPLLRVEELLEILELPPNDSRTRALCLAADLEPGALADARNFLPVDAVWRLFSAGIAACGDELLGLGRQAHPAGLTEIIVARCLQCDTLAGAMAVFCRTANLLQNDIRLSLRSRHDELLLNAVFPQQLDRRHQIYLEIACLPWHCTFRWMLGKPLPLLRFVTHSSRRGAGRQLVATFGCPIEYRGNGITLVYPQELADTRLDAPPLSQWRQRIYDELLTQLRERPGQIAERDVSLYVEQALHQGIQNQAAIAASAGMSVATLRRHLARRNTSFRALRDRVVAEHALQLLHAGATTETIAERLGYADARSFRRVFQRTMGASPSEYRDRLRRKK
jgi:AraC-like DNA-binding protein